ncbi:MAG: undecaprenyl-diphosphate phosphatase [Synergistaceae bacterium]|nr:undecaprenyl-diphosphate phosphatase [Synergistaceae bacterium]
MNLDWNTLFLGIVQGATEFLPVSSSGHLALLQIFFGMEQDGLLAFDVVLHCATILVVLIFFRNDIFTFLTQWLRGFFSRENREAEGWSYGWAVLAGSAVTACLALPLKGAVEAAMTSRLAVGAGLLVTAGLLCVVPLFPERGKNSLIKAALVVGLVQGLAVFPGISRSGSTIAAALFMGLAASEAFRLSFLMSVPAILGAAFLEALHVLRGPALTFPNGWVLSALAAFLVGYSSLVFLRRLVLSGKWAYFGVYCFFLGLAAVVSDVVTRF